MMYRLIILTGPSTGLRVTIESKPMVIGRDPDCAIRVFDEEVAKKHAVIEHKHDGIYIRDLGSMNRILVNQYEVHETRLKHGDVIELGLTRFLVQALVQADVTDEEYMEKRARKVALVSVAGAFLVLIAVAAGVGTLIKKADQASNAPLSELLVPTEEVSAVETVMPTSMPSVVEGKGIEIAGIRESLQPVSDELRLVREDLADLRATMKTLAVQPVPPPPVSPAAPLQPEKGKSSGTPSSALRTIKIASVEQQKFPASDEFDEMRMLNIGLSSEASAEEIDSSAVHVEVSFFDEDSSNQVSLTRVIAPKEPLTPDGAWGKNEQKTVTATYVVPPGFRNRETGGAKKYYGYRIRVFYHNDLQDADARPKSLLNGLVGGVTNRPGPSAAGTDSS
jgi:pSer/pThr/pTyr-binding forkhead associated (FHA) protein